MPLRSPRQLQAGGKARAGRAVRAMGVRRPTIPLALARASGCCCGGSSPNRSARAANIGEERMRISEPAADTAAASAPPPPPRRALAGGSPGVPGAASIELLAVILCSGEGSSTAAAAPQRGRKACAAAGAGASERRASARLSTKTGRPGRSPPDTLLPPVALVVRAPSECEERMGRGAAVFHVAPSSSASPPLNAAEESRTGRAPGLPQLLGNGSVLPLDGDT